MTHETLRRLWNIVRIQWPSGPIADTLRLHILPKAKPNSFREWYRILRQHNHFSIWEALTFARWLAQGTRKPIARRLFELFHGEVR